MENKLTLFIPGLSVFSADALNTLRSQLPDCPALSRLLTLASRCEVPHPGVSTEERVCHLFNYQRNQSPDFPIAALEAKAELAHFDPTAWYMKATPVHLVADRDNLVLLESLEFETVQTEQIVSELNALYKDEPWAFCRGQSGHLYIQSSQTYDLTTTSLAQAKGKSLIGCMPQGHDAGYWRSVLTEIQMFLHSHSINSGRESQGLTVCNSLWFWGSGQVPALPHSLQHSLRNKSWNFVYSDMPLVSGLASLAGIEVSSAAVESCLQQTRQQLSNGQASDTLIVLDELPNFSAGHFPQWCEQLQQLEQTWFEPLLNAVDNSEISLLTLMGDGAICFLVRKRGMWQALSQWRTKHPWYEHIRD